MRQQYPYSKRWDINIVVILHINGYRAVFLLLCVHKDTGPVPVLCGKQSNRTGYKHTIIKQ